jgi:GH15 family glucan-1,4-alpha-glucosidase
MFVRFVQVTNESAASKHVKLFFHQQFRIGNARGGDTAYYDPDRQIIVHYRDKRVFAIGLESEGKAFREYSVGNFEIEGKEGVWKDAEDGELMGCAAEHGLVDSAVAYAIDLEAGATAALDYWIACGKDFVPVYALSDYARSKKVWSVLKQARKHGKKMLKQGLSGFADLEPGIVRLYTDSLFVLDSHTGKAGEIIASGDSGMFEFGKDTYAYVWPRDASFIARALDQAGYPEKTEKYADFCRRAISPDGYFCHKYLADGFVGSSWHAWVAAGRPRLAIQEEETALPVYWLYKHYKITRDKEKLAKHYSSWVRLAADFMCSYRSRQTGLPLASFDIWEQDFAPSTFGCSAVYAGLKAAGKIARLAGDEDGERRYTGVADEIRQAILEHLYSDEMAFFHKAVTETENGLEPDKRIDMSSFYGAFCFGVLDGSDERLHKAYEVALGKLDNQTPVGGVARYEGDEFFRTGEDAPANPWFITTFWKAQYEIARAGSRQELERVKDVFWWAVDHATESNMLSEQVRSDTGEQVSASPLAWSHAEYVSLVIAYARRYQELG